MRVQMLRHITGSRNGQPWPLKGGEIDLPDLEAADLIAAGHAKEATADAPAPSDPQDDVDVVEDDEQPATVEDDEQPPAVEDVDGAAGDSPLSELDKDELLAYAAEHSIDVSPRWGERRIRDAILAAEAGA